MLKTNLRTLIFITFRLREQAGFDCHLISKLTGVKGMGQSFGRYWSLIVLSLIWPCIARSANAEVAEAPSRINLRIYNYVSLPPWVLARVKKKSSRFFQDIGIEIVWMECALSPADADRFPGCPQQLGAGDLILKLISRFPSKHKDFRDTLFGYAAGFQASIVCNRTEEIGRDKEVSESQILGLAIAHEIGHLLLGANSHSPTGIMRAQWDPDDLVRATR